jgi:hypothetical protein
MAAGRKVAARGGMLRIDEYLTQEAPLKNDWLSMYDLGIRRKSEL